MYGTPPATPAGNEMSRKNNATAKAAESVKRTSSDRNATSTPSFDTTLVAPFE